MGSSVVETTGKKKAFGNCQGLYHPGGFGSAFLGDFLKL